VRSCIKRGLVLIIARPYCLPVGPDAIVEVFAKHPVRYGIDPIILGGKLAVLRNDPSGVLYRLTEAELVEVDGK